MLLCLEFTSQSFVLVSTHSGLDIENPEASYKTHTLSKDKKVTIESNEHGLVIDYSHYLNCQALGESSV